MKHKTFNIIGGLFILVAMSVTCSQTQAAVDPEQVEAELLQLCMAHGIKHCPSVTWSTISIRKEAGIACGYAADGERACDFYLWTGTDKESIKHEFAHLLTWINETDGKRGKFGHGNAYKRARLSL